MPLDYEAELRLIEESRAQREAFLRLQKWWIRNRPNINREGD